MMDIKDIYNEQYRLLKNMGWPGGKPIQLPIGEGNQEAAKGHLLSAMVECTEALEEINWKPWKTKVKSVNYEKLTTELTDIIQFVMNVAIVMDITPRELSNALRNKLLENYRRIETGEVTNDKSK